MPAYRIPMCALGFLAVLLLAHAVAFCAPAPADIAASTATQPARRATKKPAPPGRSAPTPPLPAAHEIRSIEGWSVRVDRRLLAPPHIARGRLALKLLEARLAVIAVVVPPPARDRLRVIPIQLDLSHGNLRSMQYHPSAKWLKTNGYSENLERCVHIPDVERFLSLYEVFRQPWAVLHELAHAYHHQVLGWDEPRIRAAYERFKASGRYESTLFVTGNPTRHYALTNEKEFFAEMTECYFGMNDFFPFVAGELRREEPAVFDLMREIWGPLPGQRK
ncbi:MAG: metallopeptidase [Candidatus Sumerlaeia bacterium]|nr:metallopeptidase [Candidatus Sumerlaeia bacterium]